MSVSNCRGCITIVEPCASAGIGAEPTAVFGGDLPNPNTISCPASAPFGAYHASFASYSINFTMP
jgi:hypothetical protein